MCSLSHDTKKPMVATFQIYDAFLFESLYNNGFVWKSQQSAYFALRGAYPTRQIYTGFYCLTSGSKYKNLVYFITYVKFIYEFAVHLLFCANSKYANEFQLNMPMIILALICCEDCCDGQGQLHHICCAEFHMGMVVQILTALDINALPLDLVAKKLDQLGQNLKSYCWFGYFILT